VPLRRLPNSRPSRERFGSGRSQQGPSVYRLRAELRVRARLDEVPWDPDDLALRPTVTPLHDETVTPLEEEATVTPLDDLPSVPEKSLHPKGGHESGVTPQELRTEELLSEGSMDVERTRAHTRAGVRAREEREEGDAAKVDPVWCSKHEKETRGSSITAGFTYLACGCFKLGAVAVGEVEVRP
jgi:hypothetical protein